MNRRSAIVSMALLALIALLLAACAAPDSDASQAPASEAAAPSEAADASEEPAASEDAGGETVRVTLEGFAFDTEELTIAAGTEVSFLNADSAGHTVTEGVDGQAAADPIIDEELAGNQATRFTFDEPGTYQITCLFHPNMNMTVVVEG